MEHNKPLFVVSGGIKLPIGYRFHPTDEELVVHYLRRKELGLPLPAAVIPELDVFQAEPWTLTGGSKEKRYFFSRLKLSDVITNDNKSRRINAGSGYWKATTKTRLVQSSSIGNQVVGIRRTLVFSQGKRSTRTSPQWVMHEFHLLGLTQQVNSGDRWVIHRLHQRKRRPRREDQVLIISSKDGSPPPPQPSSPSSSSACSSGITEVSCNGGLDQEEVSSFH